ncbi:MAG: hypothetical protein ACE5HV_02215 [Acidobacteriota bacterium]
MMLSRSLVGIVALILSLPLAQRQPPPAAAQSTAVAGESELRFEERSPMSAPAELQKRFRWPSMPDNARYELSEESFQIYLPEGFKPTTSYSLLVWISPTTSGSPPQAWREVFDRHGIIWVSANNSGNGRVVSIRVGLALDAAFNVPALYSVDETHIWLAGLSGGGRTASKLAILYPEVFDGALYIVGSDYFSDLPVTGRKGMFMRSRFLPPPTQFLDIAKKNNRYVFLTGDKDFNHDPVRTVYDGYRRDGFRHTTFLNVPEMGHTYPPAEWFEKGIEALEGKEG